MGFLNSIGGNPGGKTAAKTSNQGYDYLKGSAVNSTYLNQGVKATNSLSALLGLGGDATAQNNAFNRFRDSSGYQFQLDEGNNAITSNQASSGMLHSGATLKARERFGQGLASNYLQNYLAQLNGLSQQGLKAGEIIGGAATQGGIAYSNALTSVNNNNVNEQSALGQAAMKSSDKRLKEDIQHVMTDANGIRWYTWVWTPAAKAELGLPEGREYGVIAQELEGTKFAHAVGERDGYLTVNYSALLTKAA